MPYETSPSIKEKFIISYDHGGTTMWWFEFAGDGSTTPESKWKPNAARSGQS
jgi:hypothetical protein